jgi:RNA recognition motif-containing protein
LTYLNVEVGPLTSTTGPGPPIITCNEIKGPVGANLFVFHLPNEMTNWYFFNDSMKLNFKLIDIFDRNFYLLFRRFGTILSVHTMVDRVTGLSRGFGFVSYSNRQEAAEAKLNLNGLKVILFNFYENRKNFKKSEFHFYE